MGSAAGSPDSVDVLCCQDAGSKAACIAALKEKGYAPNHILMVGTPPATRLPPIKMGSIIILFWCDKRLRAGKSLSPRLCRP